MRRRPRAPLWAVQFGSMLAPLDVEAPTTGDLLSRPLGPPVGRAAEDQATLPRERVRLLAPVTPNQQFICQGVNYRSHVKESGLDSCRLPVQHAVHQGAVVHHGRRRARGPSPRRRTAGLRDRAGARAAARPARRHRRFRRTGCGDWLAGVTIVNDLSARDIQLPQGQFYKGKSFRGFGPVGPALVLLTPEEWQRWPQLRMRLAVNGQVRQDAYCGEMIHQPAATLTELASLHDLRAGDLVATGTPAGCAARAPGKAAMFVMRHFMSDATKWRLFIAKGRKNPQYLRPGDRISATIRTDDGAIDLGEQTTAIVAP